MNKKYKGLSLRFITRIMAITTIVITICLIVSLILITKKYRDYRTSTEKYTKLVDSADDLEQASDYLTEQGRYFVVTGEKKYYQAYFTEVKETKRRENALETIKNNIDDATAIEKLENALNESNSLMNTEYYSFRLVIESIGEDINQYPEVKDVVLSNEDQALSNDAKHNKAINLMFNHDYNDSKDEIEKNVNSCIANIIYLSNQDLQQSNRSFVIIITLQQVFFLLLVGILFTDFFLVYYKLVLPIEHGTKLIQDGKELSIEGVKEYQILSDIYNETKAREEKSKEILAYEVEHDKLTGLYNRHGYDTLFHRLNLENTVYILVDIDNFKKINDRYGHAVGDKALKRVSAALKNYFGGDDYLCRIGGDEFAILGSYSTGMTMILKAKCEQLNLSLQSKEGGVPSMSLSIGIAFGNENDDTDSLFRKADMALYETKNKGRKGVTIFSSDVNEHKENGEQE